MCPTRGTGLEKMACYGISTKACIRSDRQLAHGDTTLLLQSTHRSASAFGQRLTTANKVSIVIVKKRPNSQIDRMLFFYNSRRPRASRISSRCKWVWANNTCLFSSRLRKFVSRFIVYFSNNILVWCFLLIVFIDLYRCYFLYNEWKKVRKRDI